MLARTRAACVVGVEARPVDVDVHLANGLPGFEIVGLPETAVRESRVRVRAALANSGYDLPPRRVVLNLAPADLRKRGSSLDLAIAVALLAACRSCAPNGLEETLLFGELSLSGELRPARGLIPQLRSARARGLRAAVVPSALLEQAGLVDGLDVRGAHDLASVVAHFNGTIELPAPSGQGPRLVEGAGPCLSEVQGQETAKRALEIAAAGDHHLLMVCPRTHPPLARRPSRRFAQIGGRQAGTQRGGPSGVSLTHTSSRAHSAPPQSQRGRSGVSPGEQTSPMPQKAKPSVRPQDPCA